MSCLVGDSRRRLFSWPGSNTVKYFAALFLKRCCSSDMQYISKQSTLHSYYEEWFNAGMQNYFNRVVSALNGQIKYYISEYLENPKLLLNAIIYLFIKVCMFMYA